MDKYSILGFGTALLLGVILMHIFGTTVAVGILFGLAVVFGRRENGNSKKLIDDPLRGRKLISQHRTD